MPDRDTGSPGAERSHTLRARVYLLMLIMLPALLGISAVNLYLVYSTANSMQKVVDEAFVEVLPIDHLQIEMAITLANLHRYVATEDRADRQSLLARVGRVDDAVARLVPGAYVDLDERRALSAALASWRTARQAIELLSDRPPARVVAVPTLIRRAEAGLHDAVASLGRIHDIARAETEAERRRAEAVARWSLLAAAALCVVGIVMAVVAAVVLVRAIVRPLNRLKAAAVRFGAGDLDHRIAPLTDPEMQEVADAFNRMAGSIRNYQTRLEELSTRDGLTGALNHREFQRRLAEEIARARRYGSPLSLLVLDLDHFKAVNDTHGHRAGDEVLRAVCDGVREVLRPSDFLARYGGEEFAVVLPNTAKADALVLAERLRAVIEAASVDADGEAIAVTVSIGVAQYGIDGDGPGSLVEAADTAMYEAKQGGRNRVCVYRSHGGTPKRAACGPRGTPAD